MCWRRSLPCHGRMGGAALVLDTQEESHRDVVSDKEATAMGWQKPFHTKDLPSYFIGLLCSGCISVTTEGGHPLNHQRPENKVVRQGLDLMIKDTGSGEPRPSTSILSCCLFWHPRKLTGCWVFSLVGSHIEGPIIGWDVTEASP